jgi:hypothetical protein
MSTKQTAEDPRLNYTGPLSEGWLAQIIRPFLRHQSENWKDQAAAECATTINFYLAEQQPDWADVREAARNAGWRMVRDRSTVQKCWTIRNPDEHGWFIDKGWAVITVDPNTNRGRWLFEFAGPGPHRKQTACLVDPTPAEVLTAARLVGLGGCSDA